LLSYLKISKSKNFTHYENLSLNQSERDFLVSGLLPLPVITLLAGWLNG
jgi:hypothetical protein